MTRLEATEQRQQQMMNFLSKAVQNPAFLQELLLNQRQTQRISGPDKSECRNCLVIVTRMSRHFPALPLNNAGLVQAPLC